ncbi:38670_t:CDS:1, partial [Gigaspora margarita]
CCCQEIFQINCEQLLNDHNFLYKSFSTLIKVNKSFEDKYEQISNRSSLVDINLFQETNSDSK